MKFSVNPRWIKLKVHLISKFTYFLDILIPCCSKSVAIGAVKKRSNNNRSSKTPLNPTLLYNFGMNVTLNLICILIIKIMMWKPPSLFFLLQKIRNGVKSISLYIFVKNATGRENFWIIYFVDRDSFQIFILWKLGKIWKL